MLKVWILVFVTGQGDQIQVGTFNTAADCDEVAWYMQKDLTAPATVFCLEE